MDSSTTFLDYNRTLFLEGFYWFDNTSISNETFDEEKYLEDSLGESQRDTPSLVVLTIVYCLIFVSGVVGNVSTCIVIAKNAYMHTATNYYLFSLAVSDMMTLVFGLIPELYSIFEAYPWRFGEAFCIFKSFISETTSYASILTITAFTVERYVAICHPIKAQTFSNLSRASKMIVSIWIIACLSALPYPLHSRTFYYVTHPETGIPIANSLVCNIHLKWYSRMKYMFQVSAFVFFVTPMSIITFMYILIGVTLHGSGISGKLSDNNANTAAVSSARRAVIRMLVAVVVAFFVCWAPFHAQRLMTSYVRAEDWTPELIEVQSQLFYISGVLYFVSSTVNPILYNLMSRKYRQAFKRTMCRLCFSKQELVDMGNRSVLYSDRSSYPTPNLSTKFTNRGCSPLMPKHVNGSLHKSRSGSSLVKEGYTEGRLNPNGCKFKQLRNGNGAKSHSTADLRQSGTKKPLHSTGSVASFLSYDSESTDKKSNKNVSNSLKPPPLHAHLKDKCGATFV